MTIGKQSGHWQLNTTGDSYATEGLEATRHVGSKGEGG